MKKILSYLLCFCVVLLTACGDKFPYPYEEMKDKVVKVEIVYITYIDSSNPEIDFIKELTDDEVDDFLEALSNMKLIYPFPGGPLPPLGHVFVVYYNDGSYEKIGEEGHEVFNETGELVERFHRCFSGDDFNDLLSKFIEI